MSETVTVERGTFEWALAMMKAGKFGQFDGDIYRWEPVRGRLEVRSIGATWGWVQASGTMMSGQDWTLYADPAPERTLEDVVRGDWIDVRAPELTFDVLEFRLPNGQRISFRVKGNSVELIHDRAALSPEDA